MRDFTAVNAAINVAIDKELGVYNRRIDRLEQRLVAMRRERGGTRDDKHRRVAQEARIRRQLISLRDWRGYLSLARL